MSRQSRVQQTLNHYGIYFEADPAKLSEWLYLCPFHDDHDVGSAFFNDTKECYHCFSCGEGGSLAEFIAKIEGCTTADAAILLDNNFKKPGTYDLEATQRFLSCKLDSSPSSVTYQRLVEGVVTRLLQKSSVNVTSLRNAIAFGTWAMSFKDDNLNKKSKQVLTLYDEFYDKYITTNCFK
jgi:hypothetical protein